MKILYSFSRLFDLLNFENNLLKQIENKTYRFKVFNSNVLAKILRSQTKENFFKVKVLVLAPHPDDEVIGCGGTLKILSLRNSDIQIIYITNGVPKKLIILKKTLSEKEAIDLNKKQNFQNPIFFDLETKVQHNIKKKTNDLKLILNNLKPELILYLL